MKWQSKSISAIGRPLIGCEKIKLEYYKTTITPTLHEIDFQVYANHYKLYKMLKV